MKLLFSLIFLLVASVSGFSQTNFTAVMVDSNSAIQRPTNFLSINRILTFDTNANVVYTNTNTLTFTNVLGFGTNSVAETRTNLGLGATSSVTFSNIAASGTISATGNVTFVTNVTVGGTLTVRSLATTDPVGWVLDSAQTAADTNGTLALPDAANVLRITNSNIISAISNGRLGAFYFLINQSGTNLVISNSATITARGATNLTLGVDQSATLISTTTTNATVH